LISNLLITTFCALFVAISSSSVLVTLLGRRNRRERDEDMRKLQQERDKLQEEKGLIAANAAEVALRALRNELNAAYVDVEKRRTIIAAQDTHIEELGATVRKQTRRIVALEEWAAVASQRLEHLGITDMPPVPHEVNGG
jgi:hypothetical protein